MRVPGPRALLRTAATAEMVTWALLLAAMVLKYTGVTPALTPVAGGVHGFVFLCYAAVVLAAWVDGRWPAGRGLGALAAAVVPFATVPVERRLLRAGVPAPRWRVLEEPASVRGPGERLLRAVLRRPVVAGLVVLVVLAAVFTALLSAGPPTEWFGG